MKLRLLLIIFTFSTFQLFAQKLEYDFLFHGIGDNREFSESGKANSQTILGERAAFEIGTTLEENHQIRIGLSHLFEFGSDIDFHKPILTAYYHYNDPKSTFYFGAFPRMDLINYPLGMLTDTLQYYRPNVEGLYGKHTWDWGYQAGFVDWTGRQTETANETFLAGSFGQIDLGNYYFENFAVMYHYAGRLHRDPNFHIQDNAALAFYLGTDFSEVISTEKANIKFGTMGSFYKERNVTDGYLTAWSFVGEMNIEGKKLGIKTTWHAGQGHRITMGDRFYDVDSYVRTDLIWNFIKSKHVQGKFNWSLHLVDGSDLDQSQQISLIYRFGNS